MKIKNVLHFVILTISIGLLSCNTLQVTTEIDKTADFTKYQTLEYYGWSRGSDMLLTSNDKTVIENSFGNEFEKRGIKPVKSGGDVVVSLFLVLDKKQTRSGYKNHYYGGPFDGYYGFGTMYTIGPAAYAMHEFDVQTGSLIVDVFDKKTKKQIWQGVGKKIFDQDPLTREQDIPITVAKIMKQFPLKEIK